MKAKRRKIRIASCLLALVLAFGRCVTAFAADDGNAVADARYGVVRVLSVFTMTCEEFDMSATVTATGSAFGVGTAGEETDTFVTNRHVVKMSDEEMSLYELLYYVYDEDTAVYYAYAFAEAGVDITEYYVEVSYKLDRAYILLDDYALSNVTGIDTSRMTPCDVIAVNDEDEADLAVIRAAETVEGRVALPLASAEDGTLEVGDTVYAIGYPGSSDYIATEADGSLDYAADVEESTVTDGIISRITTDADINDTVIQHTAAINGGNSGGPLVTEYGAVVGVNTMVVYSTSASTTSYYVSMTSDEVMELLDAEGISYDIYTDGEEVNMYLIIGVIAAVVIILIIVIVLMKKKKNKPQEVPQPAAPVPEPAPAPKHLQPEAQPAPQNSIAGDSGFRVQCQAGAFAGRRFAIVGQLRIGRDPNKNDLVYPADTKGISGIHCVVAVTDGRVTLMDLGSTYGTYLSQGQRIAAHQPVTLNVGDTFSLGSPEEVFVITRKGGM